MVIVPRIVLVLGIVLSAGCIAPMEVIVEARRSGRGRSAEYPAGSKRLWTAVDAALNWSSAGRTEDHRDEGYLLAWFLGADGHAPTYVGVWVEQVQESRARVTVVSRRAGLFGLSAMNEEEFHRDLSTALGILDQGKLLPLIRPE
jgi:hypothetical protein